VDCGACDRACPIGIDLRRLTKKMEMDVKELFHYEAGMSLEDVLPLATFNPDDPQEFIM
jgi:Fe-S oxidoreductase